MADTTISSLNTVNTLSANNFIPISDGTNTTKLGTDSLFGFRNRIINGDMRIDQRNSGSEIMVTGTSHPTDRWRVQIGSGSVLAQTVTDSPNGFKNSVKLTATSSTSTATFLNFVQPIEGNNIYDFKFGTNEASNITVSFWVKASIAGTYSCALYNALGTPSRGYPSFFSVLQSNVWEKKTITLPGDTTGNWNKDENTGIVLGFVLFNLTTNTYNSWYTPNIGVDGFWKTGNANFKNTPGATFQVTGVQVEAGSTATPFEFRPFGVELALCQRYYYKISNSSANQTTLTFVNSYAGTRAFGGIAIPVTMRNIFPTTTFNKVSLRGSGFVSDYNVSNIFAYDIVSGNIISLEANTASSVLGTGNFFHLNLLNGNTAGGTSFLAFDTEL